MRENSADLATVIGLIGGTLLPAPASRGQESGGGAAFPGGAGDGASAGSSAGSAAPVRVTRLCPPRALSSDQDLADAVAVLATPAEVERYRAALAEGGGALPGLLVIGPGAERESLPETVAVVQVSDTRLALARLSQLLDRRPPPADGRHASAVVDGGASVATDAALGPGAVVDAGAVVGAGTVIGANSVVGRGARIGADCVVHANVTIYDGVRIGDRVILHSGAVIGADGFGYAASPTGAVKVRHAGTVIVSDDVEIGANTAVDRGTIADTVVGARTKIDNLCQVGHNVVIGSDCLVAGTTGIGGSVVIGDRVIIGGNVAIADHVRIGSDVRIAGRSGVTKDVPDGETWAGFPARAYRHFVRSLYLGDRLEEMWAYVKRRVESEAAAERDGE